MFITLPVQHYIALIPFMNILAYDVLCMLLDSLFSFNKLEIFKLYSTDKFHSTLQSDYAIHVSKNHRTLIKWMHRHKLWSIWVENNLLTSVFWIAGEN